MKSLEQSNSKILETQKLSIFKIWVMATRPKTLFASLGPLILSFSLAYKLNGELQILIAALTTLCTLLMQIASNLINDYSDGEKGVDTEKRLGPTRVTQSGLIEAQTVKRGYQICLVLAFILGIPLIFHGGQVIFIMGVISLFMAYAYTAGPFPLSHYALGELLAFFFFGPWAVSGSVYLQTLNFEAEAFIIGLLPGFSAAALMAINNFRDRHEDKTAGKLTLATLSNFYWAHFYPVIFILLSSVGLSLFLSFIYENYIFLCLNFALLPFIKIFKELLKSSGGRHLNRVLGLTGAYLFLSSLTLSILLLIS